MTDDQSQQIEQGTGQLTLGAPVSARPPIHVPAPQPDEKWELPGGTAWVYYGEGNQGLERPVIMADGFNLGPTDFDALYNFLEKSDFPLISRLLGRSRDVILLGFDERSASITKNAEAAIAAIMRAIAEKLGDTRLMVGGFSMGGIVTRYALAKLETMRMDHQTAVYFSYDSPHRGAVIPIALQAFAHFIPGQNDFAKQMNSAAARQMLWRHFNSDTEAIEQDAMRKQFLEDLDRVGSWPVIPLKIGVANGVGTGTPNGIPAGVEALRMKGLAFPGTVLYTQASGQNKLVADMKRLIPPAAKKIHTDGLPELDGAPGGMLDGFGLLADKLNELGGNVEVKHRSHCFVPAVSAVAIRDIDEDLYADINSLSPDQSDLDDFLCASRNEPHTAVTEELCTFLLDRLPD